MEVIILYLSITLCSPEPDFNRCQLHVDECIWDEGIEQANWCYQDYIDYGHLE